jgi:hypothetical protein
MLAKSAATGQICGRIPPRIGETQSWTGHWLILSYAVLVACVAVLYFFNPAEHGFYPSCLFYKTTGLLCPGCGTLRAVHQLLHGQIEAAFRFNALIISSLPLVALGCVQAMRYRAAKKPGLAWIRPNLLWAGMVILIAFGILRNLPGASHFFLAPL